MVKLLKWLFIYTLSLIAWTIYVDVAHINRTTEQMLIALTFACLFGIGILSSLIGFIWAGLCKLQRIEEKHEVKQVEPHL